LITIKSPKHIRIYRKLFAEKYFTWYSTSREKLNATPIKIANWKKGLPATRIISIDLSDLKLSQVNAKSPRTISAVMSMNSVPKALALKFKIFLMNRIRIFV
jgi:hypothetical protein